jgi:hypothetical protein
MNEYRTRAEPAKGRCSEVRLIWRSLAPMRQGPRPTPPLPLPAPLPLPGPAPLPRLGCFRLPPSPLPRPRSSGTGRPPSSLLSEFGSSFRWSCGAGLLVPTPVGRFEANYCVVLSSQEHDRVRRGLQLGFAASSL